MSRTITAMFNDRSEAEQAAAQLRTQIGAEARIVDQSSSSSSDASDTSSGQSSGGFWQDLKDMFVADDDRSTYEEGVRRGHFLLSAKVPEEQADRACSLIEHAGAIDIDENEQKWRSEGWSGSSNSSESSGFASGQTEGYASETGTQTQGFSTPPQQGLSETRTENSEFSQNRGNIVDEERIPIVEEQLRVGKREVERGGARVRSYVEERPVSEQVNLREEHVNVERRPVDQAISPDALDRDGLLEERNIEMRETAEQPVVAKEARVKEEVVVQKTASERTEEVNDTVRNTRVDIDDANSGERRAMFNEDRETSTERSPDFDSSTSR